MTTKIDWAGRLIAFAAFFPRDPALIAIVACCIALILVVLP